MQEVGTGDSAVATAHTPGIPSFEHTTPKNYSAVKLAITELSDIQSAFATVFDKFGRVDWSTMQGTVDILKSYQIARSGHKRKSILRLDQRY